MNELLSGFPVIKSFRAETQASRLFSQRNEQAEEAKKNKRRTEQLISLLAMMRESLPRWEFFWQVHGLQLAAKE